MDNLYGFCRVSLQRQECFDQLLQRTGLMVYDENSCRTWRLITADLLKDCELDASSVPFSDHVSHPNFQLRISFHCMEDVVHFKLFYVFKKVVLNDYQQILREKTLQYAIWVSSSPLISDFQSFVKVVDQNPLVWDTKEENEEKRLQGGVLNMHDFESDLITYDTRGAILLHDNKSKKQNDKYSLLIKNVVKKRADRSVFTLQSFVSKNSRQSWSRSITIQLENETNILFANMYDQKMDYQKKKDFTFAEPERCLYLGKSDISGGVLVGGLGIGKTLTAVDMFLSGTLDRKSDSGHKNLQAPFRVYVYNDESITTVTLSIASNSAVDPDLFTIINGPEDEKGARDKMLDFVNSNQEDPDTFAQGVFSVFVSEEYFLNHHALEILRFDFLKNRDHLACLIVDSCKADVFTTKNLLQRKYRSLWVVTSKFCVQAFNLFLKCTMMTQEQDCWSWQLSDCSGRFFLDTCEFYLFHIKDEDTRYYKATNFLFNAKLPSEVFCIAKPAVAEEMVNLCFEAAKQVIKSELVCAQNVLEVMNAIMHVDQNSGALYCTVIETLRKYASLKDDQETHFYQLPRKYAQVGFAEEGEKECRNNENCPICLEEMKMPVIASSCAHCFCFTCLFEWNLQKSKCPLCNKSFVGFYRPRNRCSEDFIIPDKRTDMFFEKLISPALSVWQVSEKPVVVFTQRQHVLTVLKSMNESGNASLHCYHCDNLKDVALADNKFKTVILLDCTAESVQYVSCKFFSATTKVMMYTSDMPSQFQVNSHQNILTGFENLRTPKQILWSMFSDDLADF